MIPADPRAVYSSTGWQGWRHWLGTGNGGANVAAGGGSFMDRVLRQQEQRLAGSTPFNSGDDELGGMLKGSSSDGDGGGNEGHGQTHDAVPHGRMVRGKKRGMSRKPPGAQDDQAFPQKRHRGGFAAKKCAKSEGSGMGDRMSNGDGRDNGSNRDGSNSEGSAGNGDINGGDDGSTLGCDAARE